jgi:predicted GNAT family N-acyltransferase
MAMAPIIKNFSKGQELQIYALIKKVYDEFVAADNTPEGNLFFYDWIKPERILQRQEKEPSLLIAETGHELTGIIEMRDTCWISLLFVHKQFQGQGIASLLFQEAKEIAMKKIPPPEVFYVHASLFSVPVYRKFGFVASGNIEVQNGIKFLPMELVKPAGDIG